MLRNLLILLPLLFLPVQSISAVPPAPVNDEPLLAAARSIKAKDYKSAAANALKSTDQSVREFILGYAAYHLEDWEKALEHLNPAEKSIPMLADYVLYYRGSSLVRLERFGDALEPLSKLCKEYPASPLHRKGEILLADALFNKGDFTGAYGNYQKFVESYPSGSDALHAALRLALCRVAVGEREKGALELRTIHQNYPESDIAKEADRELVKLATIGINVPPFTQDELYRQGVALFDLKKYEQALRVFASIQRESLPPAVAAKLQFKTGQALFRVRRYGEAEEAFKRLMLQGMDNTLRDDVQYWLARVQEKKGREEEAYSSYLKTVEISEDHELAADALMQAGFIRKFQKKPDEALTVFERLVTTYPHSKQKNRAQWESAMARYLSGDFKGAAEGFKVLTKQDGYREKALYWLAHSIAGSGDESGAATIYAALIDEFPTGYYALQHRKEAGVKDKSIPALASAPTAEFPMPEGFERFKLLRSLGMYDEARRELAAAQRKSDRKKNQLGLIRLYQEIDDHHTPIYLAGQAALGKMKRNDPLILALNYPLAFKETISQQAAKHKIPEGLIFGLIRAESQFSTGAISPVGAVGLMQIMPYTAKAMVPRNSTMNTALLATPETNIRLGVRHLKDLIRLYRGNVVSAVAAYNAGSSAVDRWRRNMGNVKEDEFIENIPYAETREYVKKVLAGAEIYRKLYSLDGTLPEGALLTLQIADTDEEPQPPPIATPAGIQASEALSPPSKPLPNSQPAPAL